MKFYPNERGGGGGDGKSFSHAEGGGGHTKFWGSIYALAGSFSHILQGARKVSTL